MTVTRRKRVKDPLSGEVVGFGPKEIYAQERRGKIQKCAGKGRRKKLLRWMPEQLGKNIVQRII